MNVNAIQNYNINKNNSFKGKSVPIKEQTVTEHIREHLLQNLYEKAILYRTDGVYIGRMPEKYMNNYIEKLVPPVARKKLSDEELRNLENYHIYKIPGTGNSFRGPLAYSDIKLLKPMALKSVLHSDDIANEVRFTKNKDKIADFIKTIQKDSVYVGCDFGSDKTDIAMYLNYFLNPSAFYNSEQPNKIPYGFGDVDFDELVDLYDKFTPEQKAAMGWTKEFEQESRSEAEKERDYYFNY